jgi:uncharacterized membrane protein
MNHELKELIQMSCLSGKLDMENRQLIYQKAEEHNISKQECDIYISGFLTSASNVSNISKTHIYGYMLYFTAFWELFWSLTLIDNEYTTVYGVFLMCFGLIMLYFSFRLMKKNSVATKILAIITLSGTSFASIALIFNEYIFDQYRDLSHQAENTIVALMTFFLITIIMILFRRFFLTEKIANKVDEVFGKKK